MDPTFGCGWNLDLDADPFVSIHKFLDSDLDPSAFWYNPDSKSARALCVCVLCVYRYVSMCTLYRPHGCMPIMKCMEGLKDPYGS